MSRREDSAKFFASCADQARSNCAPATSGSPGNSPTAMRANACASALFFASSADCSTEASARFVHSLFGNMRRNSSTVVRATSHCFERA